MSVINAFPVSTKLDKFISEYSNRAFIIDGSWNKTAITTSSNYSVRRYTTTIYPKGSLSTYDNTIRYVEFHTGYVSVTTTQEIFFPFTLSAKFDLLSASNIYPQSGIDFVFLRNTLYSFYFYATWSSYGTGKYLPIFKVSIYSDGILTYESTKVVGNAKGAPSLCNGSRYFIIYTY